MQRQRRHLVVTCGHFIFKTKGRGASSFRPCRAGHRTPGRSPLHQGPGVCFLSIPKGSFASRRPLQHPVVWGMFRAKEKPVPTHCFQIVQPKDKITEPWPSEPEIPGEAMLKAHLTFSEKKRKRFSADFEDRFLDFQSQLPRFAATEAVLGQRNAKPEVMNLANAQRLGDFMARASSNRHATS